MGDGEEKTENGGEEEPKAPVQEAQATVDKKDDTVVKEEKTKGDLGSRVKNWFIIFLLIIILVSIGTLFLWRSGVNELKQDTTFLIIVQEKGVAKAGSLYDLTTDSSDIINVEVLPAVSDLKLFYQEAECHWQRKKMPDLVGSLSCDQILSKRRVIDGLVVIKVSTITELSTEPFVEYNGKKIPSKDVGAYIIGKYWDVNLAGEDPPWMFRAKLLSEWVELYDEKILESSYGSQAYNTIFHDYREGSIEIYPRNTALLLLKYIPVEQIVL